MVNKMTRDEYTAALDKIERDTQAVMRRARNAAQRAAIRSEASRLRDSLAYKFTRTNTETEGR